MLFLVVLFLIKTTSIFKNTETYQRTNQEDGLTYSNATIQDLVNKDTDLDGILDWEEGLYGLDPTKKETTLGIPDNTAISKLQAEPGSTTKTTNGDGQVTENLTQTDQFSRELFATVVSLSQNGAIDQETIDQMANSLTEQIKNSVPKKIFTLADLKIINNDSIQAMQKYSYALNIIYTKNPIKKGVTDVIKELIDDEENISILSELDPIINQTNKIISDLVKTEVPQSLSVLHLNLINSSERVAENISDMKLFGNDTIIAMGAIIQYGQNTDALKLSATRLLETIKQKLNN